MYGNIVTCFENWNSLTPLFTIFDSYKLRIQKHIDITPARGVALYVTNA